VDLGFWSLFFDDLAMATQRQPFPFENFVIASMTFVD
jgi:hypothetical protein